MRFSCMLIAVLCFSCQKSEDITQQDMAPAAAEEIQAEPKEDFEEVFSGVTCKEQEIPSWERVISRLTDHKCVRCHNADFSWNGVELYTYELFIQNAEKSKERIESEELTIDINQLDILTYKAWFQAEMPETEKDCPIEE